jgi:hypothetical protein
MAYLDCKFCTTAQLTAIRASAAGMSPALKVRLIGPVFPVGKEAESPAPMPGQALGDGTTA